MSTGNRRWANKVLALHADIRETGPRVFGCMFMRLGGPQQKHKRASPADRTLGTAA